jgi:hypothetical protein
MSRLLTIDGFRGFFLLFMGVVHFNYVTHSILGKINHHRFGWVQDAQGFVFISGLVVGLVYGKKYLRAPTIRAISAPVLNRVRTIYTHQVCLILILLTVALLLGVAAPPEMQAYVREPFAFTLSSVLLATASPQMGILPMYIFYLLVTPFAFHALARGYALPFVLAVVLSWLFAQTGLVEFGLAAFADWLQRFGIDLQFKIGFEAFAWQIFFFCGFYFGFQMARDKLDLRWMEEEQARVAFLMSIAAIVALGVFFRLVQDGWVSAEYSELYKQRDDRGLLTFIYPIAYALDLFAVVWMLRVGVTDRSRWIRGASRGLAWLFSRRLLVVLGQHSLHVFSWHILVYYALAIVVPPLDLSAASRSIILVAAVASLWIAAFGHAWLQDREKTRARLASAG